MPQYMKPGETIEFSAAATSITEVIWNTSDPGVVSVQPTVDPTKCKVIAGQTSGFAAISFRGRQVPGGKPVVGAIAVVVAGPEVATYAEVTPSGTPPALAYSLTTVQPTTVVKGTSFTLTVGGTGFSPNSTISFGSGASSGLTTTFVSDTQLRATASPATAGTYAVKVKDPVKGDTNSLTVTVT